MGHSERSQGQVGFNLTAIGILYVTQGIPLGLAFIAFPSILRKLGFSTEAIGLMGVIILPWALKFLWAPFVDRHGRGGWGRRRSWIIPCQLLVGGLFVLAACLPIGHMPAWVIVAVLLAANTVSATQDIATDGLAVETLSGEQLGWANGLQIGGFALGMLIGGSASVVVFDHGGWMPTFALLGSLVLVSAVVAALVSEPSCTLDLPHGGRAAPSLRNMLRRPGALLVLSIAATFHFASTMAGSMLGPFLVDSGLSLTEIGIINGTGVACIAIAGALLGGFLVARYGVDQTATVSGILSALSLLLWLAAAPIGAPITLPVALAIAVVVGLAGGVAYVAFFTLFMRWASRDQAGTDFTVLQCTESCTNIAASAVAGQIAGVFGFPSLFVAACCTGLLAMGWIITAMRRSSSTRTPTPQPAAAV
jgi:PAT family beta-lactamase induction signal transducer AmpG